MQAEMTRAAAAPRSMTGFARVRRPLPDGELVVSVKSVNHRGLDVNIQAGGEFDPHESAIRSLVKRDVARGHLDVRISSVRQGGGRTLAVNHALLDGYLAAYQQAAERHGVSAEPDLNAALRLPGMLVETAEPDSTEDRGPLMLEMLEEALLELNSFREREGAEVIARLQEHRHTIQRYAGEIERRREGALPAYQARLRDRLSILLQGSAVEPQRLAQESAILADKSDISEELQRLQAHGRQFEDMLAGGGEIGKKLDFLMQEMNRETNTILSKSTGIGEAGLGVTELALAVKSEIEKVREQSLNLE